MKIVNLLFVVFFLQAISAHAQFDAKKYFTDSVSFTYQSCFTKKEKKKEVKVWGDEKCIAKLVFDSVRIYMVTVYPGSTTNTSMRKYVKVNIGDIDYNHSEIKKHVGFGGETNPATFYELHLKAKDDKHWFKSYSEFFATSFVEEAEMNFATYDDANAAKSYLEGLAKTFK